MCNILCEYRKLWYINNHGYMVYVYNKDSLYRESRGYIWKGVTPRNWYTCKLIFNIWKYIISRFAT